MGSFIGFQPLKGDSSITTSGRSVRSDGCMASERRSRIRNNSNPLVSSSCHGAAHTRRGGRRQLQRDENWNDNDNTAERLFLSPRNNSRRRGKSTGRSVPPQSPKAEGKDF